MWQTHTKVVVHSVDTDVLIALLYHSSNNKKRNSDVNKGKVSIGENCYQI